MSYSVIDAAAVNADHPVSRFHAYWRDNRGPCGCLERKDFDPLHIHRVMPFIMILEEVMVGASQEFQYRLCGTGCVELFGIDYTGKKLGDDLPPDAAAIRRAEFATVMQSKQPVFSSTELPIEDREFILVYRGVFPVCSMGPAVDQIFVVIAAQDYLV